MRKKLLLVPLVVGLLAIPGLVIAQQGGDDATAEATGSPVQPEIFVPSGSISEDEARAIAHNVHTTSTIEKVVIVQTDQGAAYSIRFFDGTRIDVLAANGEIALEVKETPKPKPATQPTTHGQVQSYSYDSRHGGRHKHKDHKAHDKKGRHHKEDD